MPEFDFGRASYQMRRERKANGNMDENGPVDLPPFILKAKGATPPTVGIALALVFLGGGAGKFMCAWLGARIGMPLTVLATEGGTAALSWAYSFRCSCFYPCWD